MRSYHQVANNSTSSSNILITTVKYKLTLPMKEQKTDSKKQRGKQAGASYEGHIVIRRAGLLAATNLLRDLDGCFEADWPAY